MAIHDSLGAIVPGTEKARAGASTVGESISAEATVITTGAATYTLKGRNGGSGAGSSTILNNSSYDSTISWEKISGFVPVTGQTVDYVSAGATSAVAYTAVGDLTNVFAVTSGNISLNPTGGAVSLIAGKTYELIAYLGASSINLSDTIAVKTPFGLLVPVNVGCFHVPSANNTE